MFSYQGLQTVHEVTNAKEYKADVRGEVHLRYNISFPYHKTIPLKVIRILYMKYVLCINDYTGQMWIINCFVNLHTVLNQKM